MDTVRYIACINSNDSVGEQVRRDIIETLAAVNTMAIGLSFPPLTEGYQWKLQQLAMADADFSIFVVGSDYGPLSATGVGMLHQAYAHAQASGKPILVLACDRFSAAGDDIDRRRRDGMLTDMAYQATVETLEHPNEVRDVVERFVDDLVSADRLKGWQPVGQWYSENAVQTELRKQIAVLQKRLESKRLQDHAPEHGHPPPELSYRIKVFQDGNMSPWEYSLAMDWREIFQVLAPLATQPQTESELKSQFEERLLAMALPGLERRHPKAHGFVAFRLDGVVFDQIKKHFRKIGWFYQSQGVWQLSELGESFWLQND